MALSYFGLKKPMLVAIIFGVIGLAAGILRGAFSPNTNLPIETNITTTILVSLPLLVTAFFFFKGARADKLLTHESIEE